MYGAEALEFASTYRPPAATDGLKKLHSENQSAKHASPLHESAKGNSLGNNRNEIAGNLLSENDGNILAFTITQAEYQRRVTAAFREEVGFGPGAAKVLAAKVECNDRTAKSWLDGKTTPHGILDRRAMARVPAYDALTREIAGLQADMDPRLQAKLQELHRLTLALAGDP